MSGYALLKLVKIYIVVKNKYSWVCLCC